MTDKRQHRSRAQGGDRGSSALSAAILSVVLVLLTLVLIQGALYFHGRNIAAAAARHGLEATRVPSGTAVEGRSAADQYLNQAGGSLQGATVHVEHAETQATVTVSGDVTSFVPGVPVRVTATVTGPVERFEP